jgi:hypothetical protein
MSIYTDLLFMQGYLTDDRFFGRSEPAPAQDAKTVAPKPILAADRHAAAAACCAQGAVAGCS